MMTARKRVMMRGDGLFGSRVLKWNGVGRK
jgi:hypothetical protein